VYCYVVWSNGWPALMGSGLSGNPPLHLNIFYCMLLMCLQVVNKRSFSLSPFQHSPSNVSRQQHTSPHKDRQTD